MAQGLSSLAAALAPQQRDYKAYGDYLFERSPETGEVQPVMNVKPSAHKQEEYLLRTEKRVVNGVAAALPFGTPFTDYFFSEG